MDGQTPFRTSARSEDRRYVSNFASPFSIRDLLKDGEIAQIIDTTAIEIASVRCDSRLTLDDLDESTIGETARLQQFILDTASHRTTSQMRGQ